MATLQPFPANTGYSGAKDIFAEGSDFNAMSFVVRQILNGTATTTLVRVVAIAAGYVDVQPLVNQVDGAGNATPHGVIHHLPFFRLQGGASAVIIDPQIGDIGMASFASHDISSVKATRKQANPGSRRRFDMADGIYVGGMLNGVPTQFVAFTDTGISISTPHALTLSAANVILDSAGNFAVTGAVVAGVGGADQVGLQTHEHPVPEHVGESSPPTPGT